METSTCLFPCCLGPFSLLFPNSGLVFSFQPTKLCAAQQRAGREAGHPAAAPQQPAHLTRDDQQL